MKTIQVAPGSTCICALVQYEDEYGEATNADALPTVSLYNMTVYGSETNANLGVTVVNLSTGIYVVTLTPNTIFTNVKHQNDYCGWVTATVGGRTIKRLIEPFRFVPIQEGGNVLSDAGNTATTFRVSETGDIGVLHDTTDDTKNTLIVFLSGALTSQIRKVTGYNTSSGFLTVSEAFTAAPSVGDVYLLINS